MQAVRHALADLAQSSVGYGPSSDASLRPGRRGGARSGTPNRRLVAATLRPLPSVTRVVWQ